jgi:hypothetical protein
MISLKLNLVLTFLVGLTGCATIFGGGPQTINLTSDPPGAAYQYGVYSGKTPATLQASRAELAHIASFKLAGYEQQTVAVDTGIQGVTWVDILFWPGFIIDFATGNAYKVNNPDLTATLTPIVTTVAVTMPPQQPAASVLVAPASTPTPQQMPLPIVMQPVTVRPAMQ